MTRQKNDLDYIVVADYGSLGRAYSETDERLASKESLLRDLIDDVYDTPVRIIGFDPKACDVSKQIAEEAVDRARREGVALSHAVVDFCEDYGVLVPEDLRA